MRWKRCWAWRCLTMKGKQLFYLRQERTVIEDFERCTLLQKDLLRIAQQEIADEDVARNACRRPLRDHAQFRKEASKLNDVLSIRCRETESEIEDNEDESEREIPDSKIGSGGMKVCGKSLPVTKSDRMADISISLKGLNMSSCVSRQECAVCTEKKLVVYKFPCGHIHCKDCTGQIFRRALDDRSLLPVRCCRQEIDQSLCRRVFSSATVIEKFELAVEEARATNKMYCPRRECGAFINLDKVAAGPKLFFTCPGCAVPLCSVCRASHPTLTCAQHAARVQSRATLEDTAFLQLAADRKYARCTRCRSFVELTVGCNHMTCLCRHEFCYRCNATWKTCTCPLWEEQNLLQAGRERAGDQCGNERVVRRHMRNLVRVEECAAHRWERVNTGQRNCENCNFFMFMYHYKCSECAHRVCFTCRFHRL